MILSGVSPVPNSFLFRKFALCCSFRWGYYPGVKVVCWVPFQMILKLFIWGFLFIKNASNFLITVLQYFLSQKSGSVQVGVQNLNKLPGIDLQYDLEVILPWSNCSFLRFMPPLNIFWISVSIFFRSELDSQRLFSILLAALLRKYWHLSVLFLDN